MHSASDGQGSVAANCFHPLSCGQGSVAVIYSYALSCAVRCIPHHRRRGCCVWRRLLVVLAQLCDAVS